MKRKAKLKGKKRRRAGKQKRERKEKSVPRGHRKASWTVDAKRAYMLSSVSRQS